MAARKEFPVKVRRVQKAQNLGPVGRQLPAFFYSLPKSSLKTATIA